MGSIEPLRLLPFQTREGSILVQVLATRSHTGGIIVLPPEPVDAAVVHRADDLSAMVIIGAPDEGPLLG
jgi:hypothetical protein